MTYQCAGHAKPCSIEAGNSVVTYQCSLLKCIDSLVTQVGAGGNKAAPGYAVVQHRCQLLVRGGPLGLGLGVFCTRLINLCSSTSLCVSDVACWSQRCHMLREAGSSWLLTRGTVLCPASMFVSSTTYGYILAIHGLCIKLCMRMQFIEYILLSINL